MPRARAFALELINRDRGAEGLPRLTTDPIAGQAAQRHVEDMVKSGFTAHIGSDGSVPEQRYTDAGGAHMIQENAACFFDEEKREIDPNPRFDRARIERIQQAFLHELPPNDGHRLNILGGRHTAAGIGLAKPRGVSALCMVQEFVDAYGSYESLPRQAEAGAPIRVSGTLRRPAAFGAVGLVRLPRRSAATAEALNATSTYRVPTPTTLYYAAGFKTPIAVRVSGRTFDVTIPLGSRRAPGLYGLSIWARLPGETGLVMVGLRTIRARQPTESR